MNGLFLSITTNITASNFLQGIRLNVPPKSREIKFLDLLSFLQIVYEHEQSKVHLPNTYYAMDQSHYN